MEKRKEHTVPGSRTGLSGRRGSCNDTKSQSARIVYEGSHLLLIHNNDWETEDESDRSVTNSETADTQQHSMHV